MTPLFLLRHGPTAASAAGAPLGRLDLPVSPEGEALWPAVKARLLDLGCQRVLCSDLCRARDHALDLGLPLERALDLAWQPFGLTKLELYAPNRALLRYHNRALP